MQRSTAHQIRELRREVRELSDRVTRLQRFVETLAMEIAVHHPRMNLPEPAATRRLRAIAGGELGDD